MKQKAIVACQVIKNSHVFEFHMPLGATWAEALEALGDINESLKSYIEGLKEEEQKRNAAPQEVAAELVE